MEEAIKSQWIWSRSNPAFPDKHGIIKLITTCLKPLYSLCISLWFDQGTPCSSDDNLSATHLDRNQEINGPSWSESYGSYSDAKTYTNGVTASPLCWLNRGACFCLTSDPAMGRTVIRSPLTIFVVVPNRTTRNLPINNSSSVQHLSPYTNSINTTIKIKIVVFVTKIKGTVVPVL
jgi:hypothetical protein